jgi:outer membrane protein OmpA-like peptidoglycan-associated protein
MAFFLGRGAMVVLVLGAADLVFLNVAVTPALLSGRGSSAAIDAKALASSAALVVPAPAPVPIEPPAPRERAPERARVDPELAAGAAIAQAPAPEPAPEPAPAPEPPPAPEPAPAAEPAPEPSPAVQSGGGEHALPAPVTLHFAIDRATLHADHRAALDQLAEALRGDDRLIATVAGHADEVGSRDHNDELSKRRARRVADYLLRAGVPAAQVVVHWFGEREPLDHLGEIPDQRNRRVEVVVAMEAP